MAPGRRTPFLSGTEQFPEAHREQGPGTQQIQARSVVAAFLHREEQAMAQAEHEDQHQG